MSGRAPRVLHLFSNAKWTGPAEPALNICVRLRDLGVQTDFACSPASGNSVNKVVETARARGVEPILSMRLDKHRHLLHNFLDQRRLRRLLTETPYDLLHCHLDNAHDIAVPVAAAMGIPLVRSHYKGAGFPATRRYARLARGTSFLIEPSERARAHDQAAFNFPEDRMRVVPGAVDVARFDPSRPLPDARKWLKIPADACVVGIVARMQTHRHFEDLWAAARRLVDEAPNTHVVVVGRGTNQVRVGMEPVRALGLEQHVHFPGYVDGDNYVASLAAFDLGVYLVPGSDGTCRAAREIMAMGKPMVVADRGMLAEIVCHEENGLVFDGSVDGLHTALRDLVLSPDRRAAFARKAREKAARDYSLEAQADAVREIYETVLSGGAAR